MRSTPKASFACAMVVLAIGGPTLAQPIFSDDFENGLSLNWGNERGHWSAIGGAYGATQPSNNPATFSSLPFDLEDMEIECDVIAADDGGVWLHTNAAGTTGVLFVLARGDAYWHTVTNNSFSGILANAPGTFTVGQNLHLRITAQGTTFRAYINGSVNPITTLTANFPSGRVGLYDFRSPGHNYDNVVVSGECVEETCCPYISRNPESITICSYGTANLRVQGAGSGLQYQWQYEIIAGEWIGIEEGANADGEEFLFTASGANSAELTLDRGEQAWDRPYYVRAVVSNGCGEVVSDAVSISLCPADFDCSGFVDLDDFTTFVSAFEEGTDNADFDQSGFVDLDDFVAFVLAFEAGC